MDFREYWTSARCRHEFLIKVSGLTMPVTASVAKALSHPFIVGVDFLETYGAKIDYQLGVISFSDDMIKAPLHIPFKRDLLVTCIWIQYVFRRIQ